MKEVYKLDTHVIAHRGASAYAPENTMASFIKARQLGIRWIEFDVQLSADEIPVVFHDDDLNRTTSGHGCVSSCSFQALQSLDAGSWFDPVFTGERIPSLSQVLAFIKQYGMFANVEIKPSQGNVEKTVDAVLQEVNRYDTTLYPNLLFSSFSYQTLVYLRRRSPECAIGFLMDEWLDDWPMLCNQLECVSIHANHDMITPDRARQFKESGRPLLCYTVNQPERANELFTLGVNAVFSDNPDKILNTYGC